ncbi:PLP-dependent aminotransferase family protein [Hydromonas duriensis]|uniref:GntR family transcriptional regulator n=1 Tax=Hydromonas duriensis TaxID=1527608 RepID=A0A4V6PY34_9BURK|nr:PLP-dependent aminotransferase family protein [Hydromonas duriensis]TDR31160.1 GntR family transcriptional regulator [Hydromonas duriensis]
MRRTPLAELLQNELERQDFHPRLPGYKRVYEAIRSAIVNRRLPAGSKLPSSRDLAHELDASRNMIVAAYDQLQAEGYVCSQTGSGTYVADALPDGFSEDSTLVKRAAPKSKGSALVLSKRGARLTQEKGVENYEVQPFALRGKMDLLNFPIKTWQRVQNQVWRREDIQLYDYDSDGGYFPLKKAVADYLRVSRGVSLSPEQVLITAGTQQSIDLISRMLADQNDVAWVENPCYWGAWSSMYANDLSIRPINVDHDGMNPSAADLNSLPPKFIYVTPSHQYPTGAVMSLARRKQLIEYAQRVGAWLLEDDYDSEFRYSGRPIASLQGLATEAGIDRVLYMGTFSKVIYPGIKLSYLVLPEPLIGAFKTALYDLYRPGQLHLQAALAEFIEQGHFTTHIRRLRQAYAQRRTLLLAVLEKNLAGKIQQVVVDAGLLFLIRLPPHIDDLALAAECQAQGLSVRALSRYYIGPTEARGLVVGFAYVDTNDLVDCGQRLGLLIKSVLS